MPQKSHTLQVEVRILAPSAVWYTQIHDQHQYRDRNRYRFLEVTNSRSTSSITDGDRDCDSDSNAEQRSKLWCCFQTQGYLFDLWVIK